MSRSFVDLQNEVLDHGFSASRYRERTKRWLNDGVHRVRRRAHMPDAEGVSALATVAGQGAYDLPAALVRVRSLRIPSEAAPLAAESIIEADGYLPTETGKPVAYALSGSQVLLRPTPDRVYTLELRLWSNSDQMEADSDEAGVPEDYTDIPISWALYKAYLAEDDFEAAAVHRQDFNNGLQELASDLGRRQTDRIRQIPGTFATSGRAPRFVRP